MAVSAGQWGGELWAAADLVTPMAIRVAATLRIADHIAAGRCTAGALAEAVDADGDALARLLAHLVSAGVLARDDAGAYSLTDLGEHLRDDHPDGVRAWIDLDGAVGRADLSLVQLLHTVRTGEAGFPRQFGRPFWEDLSADADRAASFDALMGAQHVAEAPAVAAAYDWGALGSVVDAGGGDGSLLIALLGAHPELRGTVLDLPGPVAVAERAIKAAGLGDRGGTASGSFFDPLPPGAGGYVLSRVIHDWDDGDAQRILQRCAAAAAGDGAVLIIEEVGADDGATPSTAMDLRMLTYCRGRERTVEQLAGLAATSGLHVSSVTPVRSRSIIELRSA
jgi:hypothetical protein